MPLVLAACFPGAPGAAGANPSPEETSGSGGGTALFHRLSPQECGLDFTVSIDNSHPDRRLYYSSSACGSVAAGDLDGDGMPDLFFASGTQANRLFRQAAPLKFEEITGAAGLDQAKIWTASAVLADVDNDGDLDVYCCNYDAPNRLYINQSTPGHFQFSDQTEAWGAAGINDASLTATFHDYDRDGDLDLFVGVNGYFRKGGRPEEKIPVKLTSDGPRVLPPWDRFFGVFPSAQEDAEWVYDTIGRPNYLLRNDGEAGFTDVSAAAGILRKPSHTNAVAWWDFDADGLSDLYVANDFSDPDELYRNRGDGTFEEVARQKLQHTPWFSMGAAAEDINGDGRFDFLVADMLPTTHYRQKVTMGEMGASFDRMLSEKGAIQQMVNALYVNTGTGLSLEAARQAGLSKSDWTWTVKSGDFDNDGRVDFYMPTGHTRDFNHSDLKGYKPSELVGRDHWDFFIDAPELREDNLAFRNAGDLSFAEVTQEWGLAGKTMSYGAALSDLDRDGDLDMVVNHLNDPPTLYRNESTQGHTGVTLRLKGTSSNSHGIGAKLMAVVSGKKAYRMLEPYNGYIESDEPLVHFGCGPHANIDRLEIRWPSGAAQVVENLEAGRLHTVTEPEGPDTGNSPLDLTLQTAAPAETPMFRSSGSLIRAGVREQEFDDFARQPLLPHQHSKLGPGHAWADVNGDGRLDLFFGSPRGVPGRMLVNITPDGEAAATPRFELLPSQALIDDREFEDLGCVFFDADADGDPDLFVTSGSVECEPGDPVLQDRLYLNDGQGNFSRSAESLPEFRESTGTAVAADFDRDGDIDLFAGGRVIPGQYPLPARNILLLNDGAGRFTDGTERHPELRSTGLVTAALWSDADGDGWLDLLITHEWGPVRLFMNREGVLTEATASAGTAGHTAWWNGIQGRDLDNDGDIDYVTTSFGHNTKYHPTFEHPEILYYGDFDGTGRPHLVEAKYDGDVCLPRRGLSCSSRAMPVIRQKLPTFEAFARSALTDIYPEDLLSAARKWEATTFDHTIWLNDGEGHLTPRALPPLAQIAPSFGCLATDVDADGYPDLYLVQNFYSPQQETGAMDGGLSQLLLGSAGANGEPQYDPVWPARSGLLVPGDARSVTAADLNGDARPDITVGLNGTDPRLLINEAGAENRPLAIRLRGPKGNPDAAGARVTLSGSGVPRQTAEVYAGSGYLSHSPNAVFFGLGNRLASPLKIEVRWPDGSSSVHEAPADASPTLTIGQPPGTAN